MKLRAVALGLLTLLVAGAARADGTRASGPVVLDLHSVQVFHYGVPLGVLYVSRDWSVIGDGTTASIVRQHPLASTSQGTAVTKVAVAPAAALAELITALGLGRAGSIRGSCNLGGEPPPPGRFYRYEITWYGVHGRIHRFFVSSDEPDACPPEVSKLLGAILTFEQRVIDEPGPL